MRDALAARNTLGFEGTPRGTILKTAWKRCCVTLMNENSWKTEFNARAKASMREVLLAKSWPEKVRSIERMNRMQKVAQQAMRESLAKKKTDQ